MLILERFHLQKQFPAAIIGIWVFGLRPPARYNHGSDQQTQNGTTTNTILSEDKVGVILSGFSTIWGIVAKLFKKLVDCLNSF